MNRKIDLAGMPQASDAATAGQFVRWCCRAIGLAFHPDTGFRDYIEVDGSRTFTDEEAPRLDAQMTAAFGLLPDPYAVCLAEFAAMRAGPAMPTARAGPVEGTTTQAKVLLTRRTDTIDPVLSAFTAAWMQLHLREARATAGLAVVQVPAEGDQHLDTVAVSGGLDHVIDWLRNLAGLGVAKFRYEIELPPDAAGENDPDAWADRLADRLDEPGISFNVHVCDNDEQWRAGRP